jgi:hypothetical protein
MDALYEEDCRRYSRFLTFIKVLKISFFVLVCFFVCFSPYLKKDNLQKTTYEKFWGIYDLEKELQIQKARALKIIELRKEYEQLATENSYYLHFYAETLNEERLARDYYDSLILKYNKLMNINYRLLGSSPLAATLHIKNDLPS